jgi:hypothetical protein
MSPLYVSFCSNVECKRYSENILGRSIIRYARPTWDNPTYNASECIERMQYTMYESMLRKANMLCADVYYVVRYSKTLYLNTYKEIV